MANGHGENSKTYKKYERFPTSYRLLDTMFDLKNEFDGEGPHPLVLVEGSRAKGSDKEALMAWGVPGENILTMDYKPANYFLHLLLDGREEYSFYIYLMDLDRAGHKRIKAVDKRIKIGKEINPFDEKYENPSENFPKYTEYENKNHEVYVIGKYRMREDIYHDLKNIRKKHGDFSFLPFDRSYRDRIKECCPDAKWELEEIEDLLDIYHIYLKRKDEILERDEKYAEILKEPASGYLVESSSGKDI